MRTHVHALLGDYRIGALGKSDVKAFVAANLNPKVIQERLAHVSITETMDTDGHLFPTPMTLAGRPCDQTLAPALAEQDQERIMTALPQVSAEAAGELACRPGSVRPLARADGHPSRTAVADSLMRSTREHRAGRPQSLAQEHAALAACSLLTLLRVGFTEPLRSP